MRSPSGKGPHSETSFPAGRVWGHDIDAEHQARRLGNVEHGLARRGVIRRRRREAGPTSATASSAATNPVRVSAPSKQPHISATLYRQNSAEGTPKPQPCIRPYDLFLAQGSCCAGNLPVRSRPSRRLLRTKITHSGIRRTPRQAILSARRIAAPHRPAIHSVRAPQFLRPQQQHTLGIAPRNRRYSRKNTIFARRNSVFTKREKS